MLGTRVKDLRMARHWSQVELGKMIGVSKQSVSNWENDSIMPSIEILTKLADVFGVSTDFLLGRDSKVFLEMDGLNGEMTAHIQEIVKYLKATNK